jgi:2-C-methyl-D-erythritol 4-phosphate cytidylyltransferase
VSTVPDTIKQVIDGQVTQTVARANLRRALTPQCFRLDILRRAYGPLTEIESAGVEVSDDSFLVERLGVEVVAIEGSARNIKITTAEDLAVAEALLKSVE